MNEEEAEPRYNAIGQFNFGSMSDTHKLVACRACGAVVPDEAVYKEFHSKWHETLSGGSSGA